MTREISFAYLSRLRATLLREREGERKRRGGDDQDHSRTSIFYVRHRPTLRLEKGVLAHVCVCVCYIITLGKGNIERRNSITLTLGVLFRVVSRACKPRGRVPDLYTIHHANERVIKTRFHVSVLVISRLISKRRLIERGAREIYSRRDKGFPIYTRNTGL